MFGLQHLKHYWQGRKARKRQRKASVQAASMRLDKFHSYVLQNDISSKCTVESNEASKQVSLITTFDEYLSLYQQVRKQGSIKQKRGLARDRQNIVLSIRNRVRGVESQVWFKEPKPWKLESYQAYQELLHHQLVLIGNGLQCLYLIKDTSQELDMFEKSIVIRAEYLIPVIDQLKNMHDNIISEANRLAEIDDSYGDLVDYRKYYLEEVKQITTKIIEFSDKNAGLMRDKIIDDLKDYSDKNNIANVNMI